MRITILGTRGEIDAAHPKYLKHSGVLIDDRTLLDIGEKAFLKYSPRQIFITHLHPDHAFFMTSGEGIATHVPVYAPESPSRFKEIKVISRPVQTEDCLVTPIPVIHSTMVKSLGYLVEKSNKRLFYSGDIASMKKQYLDMMKKLDLVITEASFSRKGGLIRKNAQGKIFGHAGVPDLVDLFQKITDRIVFTHFGTWFLRDIPAGIQKIKSMETNDLKLEVASDGVDYWI